jgi:hypothetical protein
MRMIDRIFGAKPLIDVLTGASLRDFQPQYPQRGYCIRPPVLLRESIPPYPWTGGGATPKRLSPPATGKLCQIVLACQGFRDRVMSTVRIY